MASSYSAQSLFHVADLVAVITGGGSGLGRVIAHSLAANGAKAVYVLGRREEALGQTRDSSPSPAITHPVLCDVTSKDSLAAAADRVRKDVGYCNAVFANSGVATAESQVFITASIAGFTRQPSVGFAYGPSKAAAMHLTKQLSTALEPLKIRVKAFAPGIYPSDMTDSTFLKDSDNPCQEGGMSRELVPLERCGTEEEMAGAALFLASRAGGYVNGNVLVTDGGRVSTMPVSY